MTKTTTEPGPWGFYADTSELDLNLTPECLRQVQRAEALERAEEAERRERIAERTEAAHNMALAEAMARAHAAGQRWNPNDPLEFYPTIDVRIDQGFALLDAQAAREARQAKREAAKVLAEHGVTGQVVVDVDLASTPFPNGAGDDRTGPASGDLGASAPGAGPAQRSSGGVLSRVRAALRRMDARGDVIAHPLSTNEADRARPWRREVVR